MRAFCIFIFQGLKAGKDANRAQLISVWTITTTWCRSLSISRINEIRVNSLPRTLWVQSMSQSRDWLLACPPTAPSPSFSQWSRQSLSVGSDESYKGGVQTRGVAKQIQSWQKRIKINQDELNLKVLLARLVNHSAWQQLQLGDKQRVFLVVVYMEKLQKHRQAERFHPSTGV